MLIDTNCVDPDLPCRRLRLVLVYVLQHLQYNGSDEKRGVVTHDRDRGWRDPPNVRDRIVFHAFKEIATVGLKFDSAVDVRYGEDTNFVAVERLTVIRGARGREIGSRRRHGVLR